MMHRTLTSIIPAGRSFALGAALSLLVVACGGTEPPPKAPDEAPAEAAPAQPSSAEEAETAEGAAEQQGSEEEGGGTEKKEGAGAPEPAFTDGMSVNEAIKAVPPGTEYIDVDQEELAKPLQQESVYEPCKPGGQHFKLRVAIWEGRAVGVDVTSSNKKLAECVDAAVRKLEWSKKVKSLSTIDYAL